MRLIAKLKILRIRDAVARARAIMKLTEIT